MQGFKAAAERKAQITDPTVKPEEWIKSILLAVERLAATEQWRAIPVLSGILQARSIEMSSRLNYEIQKTLVQFMNNSLNENDENLVVLAVTLDSLSSDIKDDIKHEAVLTRLIPFLYDSRQVLDAQKIFKILRSGKGSVKEYLSVNKNYMYLNTLSLLSQFVVERVENKELVKASLMHITSYCRLASDGYQKLAKDIGPDQAEAHNELWGFLKFSLFSVSLSLQGYTGWLLHGNKSHFDANAVSIATSILVAFQDLYFIVAQISLTGFPTFDFVYYTSLDILLDPRFNLQGVTPFLNQSSSSDIVLKKDDLVGRGKLIFLLNMFEQFVPLLEFDSITTHVLPLTTKYLSGQDPSSGMTISYYQPVLESAHSVFLALVSAPSQAFEQNNGSRDDNVISDDSATSKKEQHYLENEIPQYFHCVLDLFPGLLSPHQFTLALSTLIRAYSPPSPLYRVNPSRSEWLLEEIYSKSKSASNSPLPAEYGTKEEHPAPTYRAVIISALIHCLPFLHLSLLEPWLNRTQGLIDGITNETEKKYLEDDLFKMLSEELEQYKSTVGIRWWFRSKL